MLRFGDSDKNKKPAFATITLQGPHPRNQLENIDGLRKTGDAPGHKPRYLQRFCANIFSKKCSFWTIFGF